MPKFFVSSNSIPNDTIPETLSITGNDAYHLSRVLRIKIGEHLSISDMCRRLFEGSVIDISDEKITIKVEKITPDNAEPSINVTLYQALIKGDKFDTVVQKAVECGAHSVVPVVCERCVVKLNMAGLEKKRERWQKIAFEAAKQCGRGIIPEVLPAVDFNTAVKQMKKADFSFMCYEGENVIPIKELLESMPALSYSFLVGPEGGFSSEECEIARNAIHICGLGNRILRSETASSVVLSAIMYVTGNL